MINELRAVEDSYMELFCQKKAVQDISYFSNQIVPELYDHNFILLENIRNETETIESVDAVRQRTSKNCNTPWN